ncbi:MAG: hypothetical protein CMC08_00430 [Flavobacteriaceae bacterium]|nr:hypothetical protein [Flavobacteriaceae bacterium]|tara:strand:+ start:1034 stop:1450 length:417 start_codon:yes stop_codon:yes gene_type:complete
MAFGGITQNIQNATDKTQEYINNTAEYYKLRLFKSTMKGAISLVNLLIIGSILLLILTFLSVGVAIWIGNAVDSRAAGYFIVGGFYVVILVLLLVFGRKAIEKYLLIKFSKLVFDDDDPEPREQAATTMIKKHDTTQP